MKKTYKHPKMVHFDNVLPAKMIAVSNDMIEFGGTGDFDVKEERDEYTWTDLEW